jgi:hypothetical protein
MGDYNREKAMREFSIDKMVEGYERLFSSVKNMAAHRLD